jgi:hypothetical protein
MGSFSTLSTGETAGGGNESFYGDVSNGTRNTSGVPSPGSHGLPGVIIGQKDTDIVLIIPDTRTAGPGFAENPGGNQEDQNTSAGLALGSFVAVNTDFDFPDVVIDMGSVELDPQQTPSPPEEVEEENQSPDIVNIIDDDSLSLLDVTYDMACPMPKFNFTFESEFNLNASYYNPYATEDALENAALISEELDIPEEESQSSGTNISIDTDWAASVVEIIDSIVNVDKNVKLADAIDVSRAQWDISNTNILDDLLTSTMDMQRDFDFGYFINETNFEDFAETQPGGPDAEDIARPFDVSSFVANGLSAGIYFYNSGVNNENDIISLELVDMVTPVGANSYNQNSAINSLFGTFF